MSPSNWIAAALLASAAAGSTAPGEPAWSYNTKG